ncbi:MAG TPA: phosphotransferase [Anaerolineales bacterium]|nr:phosphotransferase [Anaerolineales bacterium]
MKKRLLFVMLFIVVSMLLALPASAVQTSPYQQEALQIAALINEYRAELNLYPFVYNTTLESVAQKHTAYQVSIEESTHYGPNRSTSKDRVEASGYGGDDFIFVSEIIYHGQFATPKAALEWWKNSPIHNEQMSSTRYHEFGVAVDRSETYIYYTVNFAAIQYVTSPGVGSAPIVPTPRVSVPVETVTEGPNGEIVHTAVEGQTLQTVADAYQVSLETLKLFNGLTGDVVLSDGQIILVKLPVVQPTTVIVEEEQSEPEPTPLPEATEFAAATAAQAAQTTEDTVATDTAGEPADQGGNALGIVLGVAGVVVVGAVIVLMMMRSSKGKEQGDRDQARRSRDPDAFENRSRAEQFELLREVAEMALDAYPLELISIEPLRYALNAEFSVKAYLQGKQDQVHQFLLRVNAPGFHSKAEIGSEMEWLASLQRETDLKVPYPLRTTGGKWVSTISLAPVGEPRQCVLFRTLPGETAEMDAAPDHLLFIGAIIAKLHKHSASFDPPSGFTRKHWDLEGLKGGMLDVSAEEAYAALRSHEREVVDAAEKVVADAMAQLGVNDQVYSLIHGDLHLGSFQYLNGQPQILDFDTCGYGYYIYDLSVAVWDLFDREDFASLKTALLQGYRTERQLSEEEEHLLMRFVAGRLMTQTLAWAARRHDPQLEEAAEASIAKQIKQLEMLLRMLSS